MITGAACLGQPECFQRSTSTPNVTAPREASAAAELLGDAGKGFQIFERVLDRAAVMMAFEQLGGAQRALEITREFTMGRYAFGRPVASFQALKHRMADVYCALELGRSNAYFGAWALSSSTEDLPVAAAGARIARHDPRRLRPSSPSKTQTGEGREPAWDSKMGPEAPG